jgi:hypothetical protein
LWKSTPLKVEAGVVKAELPEGRPLVYFVTITDERKATVSSEHEEVAEK